MDLELKEEYLAIKMTFGLRVGEVYFVALLISCSFAFVKHQCYPCFCPGSLLICDSIQDFSTSSFPNTTQSVIINNSNLSNFFAKRINFPSLKHLHVKNSVVYEVSEKAFQLLENLQILELFNSKVYRIHPMAFHNSTELSQIDLSRNEITAVSNTLFSRLSQVNKINLSYNKLSIISNSLFYNNTKVNHFKLCRNRIKTIEAEAFNIRNVTNFSAKISRVVLNMSCNELQEVRDNVFILCSHLTVLDLSHNRISKLERNAFIGLNSLRELNLGSNDLNSLLPSVFAPLAVLQILDIQKNNLKDILPEYFIPLKNLVSLNLSGNNIKQLQAAVFQGLLSLIELRLEDNHMEHLGLAFKAYLPQLSLLNVSGNHVTNLRSRVFSGCSSLLIIDLSRNQIMNIEDYAFQPNNKCEYLFLQINFISKVSCRTFEGLSSLLTLNLLGSELNELRFNYFHQMKQLKDLDISLGEYSACDCSLFAKLKEENVNLKIRYDKISDECQKLVQMYQSPNLNFDDECFNFANYTCISRNFTSVEDDSEATEFLYKTNSVTENINLSLVKSPPETQSTTQVFFSSKSSPDSHSRLKTTFSSKSSPEAQSTTDTTVSSKPPTQTQLTRGILLSSKSSPETQSTTTTFYRTPEQIITSNSEEASGISITNNVVRNNVSSIVNHPSNVSTSPGNQIQKSSTNVIPLQDQSSSSTETSLPKVKRKVNHINSTTVRVLMYVLTALSLFILLLVLGFLANKMWLKFRYNDHVYEEVRQQIRTRALSTEPEQETVV